VRTQATASTAQPAEDRRRHERVAVGLPVEVHVDDHPETLTVELMDIAAGGARLRPLSPCDVPLNRRATFGFIVPGGRRCVAAGRVARVQASGDFVVVLDRSNPAFLDFLAALLV
jgi:PilZ domain